MQAVGDYVIIEIQQTKSASGIISMHRNEGICKSCSKDPSIEGKKVLFASKDKYDEHDGFLFIPYNRVLAVIE